MLSDKFTFEWDLVKELENIQKHSVDFTQASEVFVDPRVMHFEDPQHSILEKRFYAVGQNLGGRVITVRYTLRGHRIRIIGAARWRKWRRFYEKNTRSKDA